MAAIQFENRFILTRRIHKEYCKLLYRKTRKKFKITCFVLAAVSLVAALLLIIFTQWNVLSYILMFLSLYFIAMAFYGYSFSEWINYSKMKDEHGGEVFMILKFEPTRVIVQVNKTSFAFKYTSISAVYETDDIIILVISGDGMIDHGQLVYKNGFTEKNDDTLDRFMEFINTKAKSLQS